MFLNTIGSWDQLKSLDSSARNVPTGELLWYSLCWLSFCLQIFLRRPQLGIDPKRAKLPCLDCLCEESVQPKGWRLSPLPTDEDKSCQEKDICFWVRWLQMASGGAKSSTTFIPLTKNLPQNCLKCFEQNLFSWEGNTISQWFLFYQKT